MSPTPNLPPLPGFGLSLNHENYYQSPPQNLFPSALTRNMRQMQALTLRELKMLQFMNQVTDKNEWQSKIYDESILKKWKAESKKSDFTKDGDDHGDGCVEGGTEEALSDEEEDSEDQHHDNGPSFTEAMFQHCIDELRWKARLYTESGFISVFNGDVIKSDAAIPADLQAALKAAVAPLENVPPNKQDWHPGSDEQVLDLVHPSLFPLVYGLSRILPNSTTNLDDCIKRCGEGEILPIPTADVKVNPSRDGKTYDPYSMKFQWLPCEVDISGDTPKILTYINNLRPNEHAALYQVIEKILGRVIPLWNATLSPWRATVNRQPRIRYEYTEYDDEAWEEFIKQYGPKQEDFEDEDDYEDIFNDWETDHKWHFYTQPDVDGDFAPPLDEGVGHVDLKRDYSETGLQVIVKLANIHLTPEKPQYPGGTWHVEGQLNEHICASAIYYYDCDNISSSRLAFRQAVTQPDVNYEQNDNDWIKVIFGLRNWEAAIQDVGSIETREGRVITFPNLLQHQVQPFELEDPTKPGHRKILALFLVDPNTKIISTANVPCQRRDWWAKSVFSNTGVFARLPTELRDKVVQDVEEFPIDVDQAKKLREILMEERKEYVVGYQQTTFSFYEISLCEH